uniref:KIB1-4 beta-propeller domain-containing protein n=1 Tax=Fagus sylvatica TaxID=28930 RepID=A0A2N9HT55_FAGSY
MELATVEKQNKDSHPFIAPKSYPWLVICDGKHEERQTFFDISTNRYHIQSIPEMCNKLIYASSHGWLVLVEYKLQDCCCCLWNPISLEKIQLPQLESIDYNACTLSSSPSDPECHILFFNPCEDSLLVCQPGDLKFNKQENVFGNDYSPWNLTVVGKTIYALTTPGYTLFTGEFVGPKVEFTRLIMGEFLSLSPPDVLLENQFLIECGGELFLVHMMYFGLYMDDVYGFFVFQMDFAEKKVGKSEEHRRTYYFRI